jgi:transketolase
MHSPAACEIVKQLGLRLGRANLDQFAATLLSLAKENRDVLALTSDSRGSGKLGPFAAALPEQIVELGIAEQNLVGVSAGLASAGKIAFAVSPASFLTARSLEQIKNDVAYSNHPVKLIGISAGVSYGALGSTHHSLHDLAALRAINNIDIVAPADNFETRTAILAAAGHPRPIYLRFGKAPMYDLPRANDAFQIGRAITLRQGSDLAFIATGETVIHALLAAEALKERGLSGRVISMHTIKPLDVDAVLSAGRECGGMVTVEEHSVAGGLGEACAAVLLQAGIRVPFRIVGFPDEETITGSQADIFRHYGITMESLGKTSITLSGKLT